MLVAGASGAAAAVSMMAGTYLDAETARDEARAAARVLETKISQDADGVLRRVMARLGRSGLDGDPSARIERLLSSDKASLKSVAGALEAPEPGDGGGPVAQALWMLLADFFAAAIPIVPFALGSVPDARIVSGTVTLVLLVGLGVGRALLGKRSIFRTVVETVAIGVAAALAGVAIGVGIGRAFGR